MSTELETAEGPIRIRVPLEPSPGAAGPTDDYVWAEPLGSDRFRIESCAFFAYGISRNDVIHAASAKPDEAPQLEDVMEKCGHRTLRIALDSRIELPDVYLKNLSPEARKGIYRAACRMAMVDHVFAHAERKMLDRLQTLLGIPSDIADEIEADVPGMQP